MITILTDICNPISQDFYDNQVNNLQLHKLTCPCGHSGCLSIHGYYKRKIKSGPFIIRLRIRRMICALCKATHALLLSSMVPYSQIPFQQHVEILIAHETSQDFAPIMEAHIAIDESNIRYVVKQYRNHWSQRLLSATLSLDTTTAFICKCFSHFNRQLMQIKRTPNLIFLNTT
jgi:hypothetical protein